MKSLVFSFGFITTNISAELFRGFAGEAKPLNPVWFDCPRLAGWGNHWRDRCYFAMRLADFHWFPANQQIGRRIFYRLPILFEFLSMGGSGCYMLPYLGTTVQDFTKQLFYKSSLWYWGHVGFPSIVLKNSAEYPTNSVTNTCKAIGRKDPAQKISCIHIL